MDMWYQMLMVMILGLNWVISAELEDVMQEWKHKKKNLEQKLFSGGGAYYQRQEEQELESQQFDYQKKCK